MLILSVNRKLTPSVVGFKNNQPIESGIDKEPLLEAVMITPLGLEHDVVIDTKNHGGTYKAIYTYASEHYPYWQEVLDLPAPLRYGTFGENLTTHGLDERSVCIGDQFQIGHAIIQATEPRLPCATLGHHMKSQQIVKQFMDSGRMGIYFRVIQPGLVQTQDAIIQILADPRQLAVSEITRVYTQDKSDKETLQHLVTHPMLPPKWKIRFEEQLEKRSG